MKDEGVLDSAGPVFIVTCLVAVLVFATWVIERGSGSWGKTVPHTAEQADPDAGH
ncbi:MAG: hypothetical protein JRH10_13315 [Deltaproteobacteria bacterium]|nr:hypothetical protein [Deltaproteobacteria bacterium]MBW2447545.1 hypothetical protein [Deltaproteobacteria bacterium]